MRHDQVAIPTNDNIYDDDDIAGGLRLHPISQVVQTMKSRIIGTQE